MIHELKLPTRLEIIEIQNSLIEEFGGATGLRDATAIDSALARAEHLVSYEKSPDIFKIAAAVCGGINQNHAFVDGNKRIAFVAAYIILRINDFYLDASEHEAFEVMMKFTTKEITESDFSDWLNQKSFET